MRNPFPNELRHYNRPTYHNELMHYGVKGMKKGVRQYQNADGSLTPLGREHYGVGMRRAVLKPINSVRDKIRTKNYDHQKAKTYAKYGAIAAAGVLGTIGIYKLGQANYIGQLSTNRKAGKAMVKKMQQEMHEQMADYMAETWGYVYPERR